MFYVGLESAASAQIAAPSLSPTPGDSPVWFDVNITGPGTIRFTLDGSEPDLSSALLPSEGKVRIWQTLTLKARAWGDGADVSQVEAGEYRVTGSIDGGGAHSLWLKSNGTLYAWGDQGAGRLGNGVMSGNANTPQSVQRADSTAFSNVIDVSAGVAHSLVVDRSGAVWAFGSNAAGQLGQNNTTDISRAQQVRKSATAGDYLTGCLQVSAGSDFSLALGNDGSVWAWGNAANGRIGNGISTGSQTVATQVLKSNTPGDLLGDIEQIAAGGAFAVALDQAHNVWAWGSNSSGQLGAGVTGSAEHSYASPVDVDSAGTQLSGVTEVAAGTEHALAVKRGGADDGTVWSWGTQSQGRLGNGSTASGAVAVPAKVQKNPVLVTSGESADLSGIIHVASGPRHCVALDASGHVWTWGANDQGQLGHHGTTAQGYADLVYYQGTSLSNIVAIGAGGSDDGVTVTGFTYAIDVAGQVYSWGANAVGQLGDGTTVQQTSPVVGGGSLRLTNQAPTVSELQVSGITVAPAAVNFSVQASDSDGCVSRVEFYVNGSLVGSANSAPYTLAWNDAAAGVYMVTACAIDDMGAVSAAASAQVTVSQPTVTVVASDASASESLMDTGAFTITRNSGRSSAPLTVSYSVTGTATPGSDYVALSGTIVVPVGANSATISVIPQADVLTEGAESVTVTLSAEGGYTVGALASDTVSIADSSPSGIRLWLKADEGITTSAGTAIASWGDQSGVGTVSAVQGTATSQPQLVANVVNGRPVVRFTGTQFLTLPNVMAGATQGEVFIVHKAELDAPSAIRGGPLHLGGSPWSHYPYYSDKKVYETFGSTSQHQVGDPAQPLDQFHLFNVSSQAGEWVARFNTQQQYQATTNTVGFATAPLVGSNGDGYRFAGDIAEILVYDRVLTAAERKTVENYLGIKYALVAAPSTPSGLVATGISPTQVSLKWTFTFNNYRPRFVVERRVGSGGYEQIAVVENSTSYIDTTPAGGTEYSYRVCAVNAAGSSEYSTEAGVITPASGIALPLTGVRVWLKADAIPTGGVVSVWADQSGVGTVSAVQGTATSQPQLVANVVNGRPVVRFTGTQFLTLPNVMAGATQGEVFIVHKAELDAPSAIRGGPLHLGGSPWSHYPYVDKKVYETFGSTSQHQVGDPAQPLDQFHLFNVSSQAGEWVARFNALQQYRATTNTVGFATAPLVGSNGDGYRFAGDIAEILVYDRVLTAAERKTVENYLGIKYALVAAPSTPSGLVATGISPTQVSLKWNYDLGNTATSFSIERRSGSGAYEEIAVVDQASSYIDPSVQTGTAYSYRVRAVTMGGSSGYSNEAQATTLTSGTAMPLNPRLWLKADTGTTYPLSSWADLSRTGAAVAVQGNAAFYPLLVANALSGRPVVRFNGSGQCLSLPDVMSGATAGDLFVVVKAVEDTTTTTRGFLRFGTDGVGSQYPTPDPSKIYEDFGRSSGRYIGDPVQRLDQFHLYNVSSQTGDWTVRFNGQVHHTTSTNTVAFTTAPYIGRNAYGQFFYGDIAEILVYDRVLTAAERKTVEEYVISKYHVGYDSDQDGIADAWELRHFSNLSQAGAVTDADGDGLSDLNEYLGDSDPVDYYNGQSPVLTKLPATVLSSPPSTFVLNPATWQAQALTVQVRNAADQLLVNAPVTFSTPSNSLSESSSGQLALASTLAVRTDSNGVATVYYVNSPDYPATTHVEAVAGTAVPVQFTAVTTPLVGYWSFNDPLGSTSVMDFAHAGNVGLIQSGANLVEQGGFDSSRALALIGSGSCVLVPDSTSLDLSTTPFTIFGWVKLSEDAPLAADTDIYGVVGKRGAEGPGFDVALRGGTYNGLWVRLSDGVNAVEASPNTDRSPVLRDGHWHQLAVVRAQDGNLTLYVDGINVGGATGANIDCDNNAPLTIGSTTSGASLRGAIDELKITREALSPSQVVAARNQDGNVDGFPDWWATRYLGGGVVDPSADPDDDGFTNRQEYDGGTSPTDWYNGQVVVMTKVPTADLSSPPSTFVLNPTTFGAQPLTVYLKNAANQPWVNSPVTFSGPPDSLTTSSTGQFVPSTALTLRTDSTGAATVYFINSPDYPATSQVDVTAGEVASVKFTAVTTPVVGWWNFNDAPASTTLDDLSHAGNIGTLNGSAALVEQSGFDSRTALSLSGNSDSYVSVQDSSSLDLGTTAFTLVGWVKLANGVPLAADTDIYGVIGRGDVAGPGFDVALRGGSYNGLWVRLSDGTTTFNVSPTADQSSVLRDGFWHQFAVVRDQAGVVLLYLDGANVGGISESNINIDSPAMLRIGKSSSGALFCGFLDEVKITREALTSNQINILLNQDSNGDGIADWWATRYFGGGIIDGSADPDGDGVDNLAESLQGRDPTKGAIQDEGRTATGLIIYAPAP